MCYNTLVSTCLVSNPQCIVLVVQLLKKKLGKLISQNLNFFVGFTFFFSNRQMVFVFENFGSLYRVLSFLQFLDKESIISFSSLKNQIVDRFGVYKTNIQEEQALLAEESKLRISKKFGKRYRFFVPDFGVGDFSLADVPVFGFKNFIILPILFPNKNIIEQEFFLHISLSFFKTYRKQIFFCLSFFCLQSFFLFCFLFNYVFLSHRLNFLFYFIYANNSSSC